MIDKRPKILAMPSVSQVPRLAGVMCRYRFLCKYVQLAGVCISFDGRVELIRIECFKPCAKPCQL